MSCCGAGISGREISRWAGRTLPPAAGGGALKGGWSACSTGGAIDAELDVEADAPPPLPALPHRADAAWSSMPKKSDWSSTARWIGLRAGKVAYASDEAVILHDAVVEAAAIAHEHEAPATTGGGASGVGACCIGCLP